MTSAQRVRVIGGPWKERIGCLGHIVEPTPEWQQVYPFVGLQAHKAIIVLDDDPLSCRNLGCEHESGSAMCTEKWDPRWSCVINRRDLERLETPHITPPEDGETLHQYDGCQEGS